MDVPLRPLSWIPRAARSLPGLRRARRGGGGRGRPWRVLDDGRVVGRARVVVPARRSGEAVAVKPDPDDCFRVTDVLVADSSFLLWLGGRHATDLVLERPEAPNRDAVSYDLRGARVIDEDDGTVVVACRSWTRA